MRLQRFVLGELEVNSYLLWDEETREASCFDPGGPPHEILAALKENNLQLKYILLTHGHYDHIGGANELKSETGALVAVHAADAAMLANPQLNLSAVFGRQIIIKPDQLLADGDVLCLGAQMLKILHTPGHTPGGISVSTSLLLFSGDTLLPGVLAGRICPVATRRLWTGVCSGWCNCPTRPRFSRARSGTTIGREKQINPFLK